jgi:hypothetical protein
MRIARISCQFDVTFTIGHRPRWPNRARVPLEGFGYTLSHELVKRKCLSEGREFGRRAHDPGPLCPRRLLGSGIQLLWVRATSLGPATRGGHCRGGRRRQALMASERQVTPFGELREAKARIEERPDDEALTRRLTCLDRSVALARRPLRFQQENNKAAARLMKARSSIPGTCIVCVDLFNPLCFIRANRTRKETPIVGSQTGNVGFPSRSM